jgi:hypothetical protein
MKSKIVRREFAGGESGKCGVMVLIKMARMRCALECSRLDLVHTLLACGLDVRDLAV